MKACLFFILTLLAINCQARQPRNMAERAAFMKMVACPATVPHKSGSCPGFIIDHDVALRCARTPEERKWLDSRWNMHWQTKAESLLKDKTEGDCGWRKK